MSLAFIAFLPSLLAAEGMPSQSPAPGAAVPVDESYQLWQMYKSPLVFPGVRSPRRPMSENTINAALRRLGYPKDQMTGHGFRHMASTLLNEQGWSPDAIERQLAHRERNKIRATYNFAEFLPERRKMMQTWADYLDALRENRKVVAGHFGRAA